MSSLKYHLKGTQNLMFCSFTEFKQLKEHEEETTYTTYVWDDHVYVPKSGTEGIISRCRYYYEHSITQKIFCVQILHGSIMYVIGMANTLVIRELNKLNRGNQIKKLPES